MGRAVQMYDSTGASCRQQTQCGKPICQLDDAGIQYIARNMPRFATRPDRLLSVSLIVECRTCRKSEPSSEEPARKPYNTFLRYPKPESLRYQVENHLV